MRYLSRIANSIVCSEKFRGGLQCFFKVRVHIPPLNGIKVRVRALPLKVLASPVKPDMAKAAAG